MRTATLGLLLLLPALMLAGCNGNKLAVINTEAAFQESRAGVEGKNYLQGLRDQIQEELIAEQQALSKNKNREKAQAAFQQKLMDAEQRMGAENQNVMNKLTAAFQSALEAVRSKGKYDVVLDKDAALASTPKADITKQVIDEMNKAAVSFTPLAKEAPEKK